MTKTDCTTQKSLTQPKKRGRKKLTTEEVVARLESVHGKAFDYSMVEYTGANQEIVVKCNTCGSVFQPTYANHSNNKTGCPNCNKGGKLNLDDFIKRSNKKHNFKYDYSQTVYKGTRERVDIVCPIHGLFSQNAKNHLDGYGCAECGKDLAAEKLHERNSKTSFTPEKFKEESVRRYGEVVEYDLSNFTTTRGDVRLKCPHHGWFVVRAHTHLYGKNRTACPNCGKGRLTSSQIKEQAAQKHGSKFDYSLITDNLALGSRVTVVCPDHGKFNTTLKSHLNGKDCPTCEKKEREAKREARAKKLAEAREARRKKAEACFIQQAIEVHDGRYTYENFKYEIGNKYAVITCSKHGDFKQQMQAHIRKGRGCPECGAEESCGWSKESYVEMCRIRSKGLSTLYAVTMTSSSELFFKVGITHKTVKERFANKEDAPYDVKELYTVTDDASYIYDLEKRLHKLLKKHNYQPKQKFGGYTECFTTIKPIEKLLKQLTASDQLQLIA